jgi:D-arginine dehydrogenase
MAQVKPRLAVIGGGIAGVSVAARASGHFAVTVLEAEMQPAYHSSGRSAAVAIECYENEVVRALTLPGLAYHRAHGAREIGCVALSDSDHLELLDQFEAEWAPVSSSLEEMPVTELLDRVPILRADRIARAMIERDALSLDAHALLESFRKELLAAGGQIVTGARVAHLARNQGSWNLSWDGGSLDADIVVNAAGAWGDSIAALAGVSPLGLTPLRRTAVLIDVNHDVSNWPLIHLVQGDLYFKPEAGLLMVSPADETPSDPCDSQPEELDIATAVDRFESITDVRVAALQRTWAGLRTFLPDEIPGVGFDSQVDGFFWLVGQGGFGIQTSPYLSQVAATLLAGGDHELAARLDPGRFGKSDSRG